MIFRFRHGPARDWPEDRVLYDGEPGYEDDTGRFKIGDGVSQWKDLKYFSPEAAPFSSQDLLQHINSENPHPVYDDGPSLYLLYENAKV